MHTRGAPSRRRRSLLLPLLFLAILTLSLLLMIFHLRPWDRQESVGGLPAPSAAATEPGIPATPPPPMEASVFLSYQRRASRALYLPDGRILFAMGDTKAFGSIFSLDLVDAAGTLLWSTPVSPSYLHENTGLAQLADGSFAFLSYLQEGAAPARILLLSPEDGALRSEVRLPDWAMAPFLYEGGVFARTEDGIVKFTLDGEEAYRLARPLYPFLATQAGDRTYFSGWRYVDETFQGALLCLDEGGNLLWQFTEERESSGWCPTADGGLLFDMVRGDATEVRNYLYRMDASGNVLWHKQVIPYGVVHLMEEQPDGSFAIYGAVMGGDSPHYSYRLRLDAQGNHLESTFKAQWGQCWRYIDGEVYAVVYDHIDNALQAVDFLPFDEMPDQQRAPFVLQ